MPRALASALARALGTRARGREIEEGEASESRARSTLAATASAVSQRSFLTQSIQAIVQSSSRTGHISVPDLLISPLGFLLQPGVDSSHGQQHLLKWDERNSGEHNK